MPWIQNISLSDVRRGFHIEPGSNAMLIQITDPASWRPTPKHQFKEVHHFEFLDVEAGDHVDICGHSLSSIDDQRSRKARLDSKAPSGPGFCCLAAQRFRF